jgi:hypothetical protein
MQKEDPEITMIQYIVLLTIVFIIQKILGVIEWSWFWVLSPIWILTIFCLIGILFIAFIGIFSLLLK